MKKLTTAQDAALSLLGTEWISPYDLKVKHGKSISMATLDALVRKGFAENKSGLGCLFSPQTSVKYRRK